MAGGNAIQVYCDGPLDNAGEPSHDRFVVPFNRIQLGSKLHVWSDGVRWTHGTDEGPTRRSNRVLVDDRPGEVGAVTGGRGQFRLRCPRCGYDDQRNTPSAKGVVPAQVAAVFDRLTSAGVYEISMRALIRYAYPGG